MDIKWDTDENTKKIQKETKIIVPVNSIKIGNSQNTQKQYEDVNEVQLKSILEKNVSTDTEYSVLCDSKIVTESIIKYLIDMKKIEYKNINIGLVIERIRWIKKICAMFMDRKKLHEIIHAQEHYQKKNCCILRNSYNFCDNSYDCKYYYSKYKSSNTCNKQHFVYNYIVSDIIEIEKYIESIEDTSTLNFDEINKSIKTLNFVVEHMKNEIDCRNKNANSIINKTKKSNVFGIIDNEYKEL